MNLENLIIGAGIAGVAIYALSRFGNGKPKAEIVSAKPKAKMPGVKPTSASKPNNAGFTPYSRQSNARAKASHAPRHHAKPRSSARENSPSYDPHRGRDTIGLTAFHERGFIVMPPSLLNSPKIPQKFQELQSKIDGMGTNITDGLRKAINLACETPKGRRKRIVLLSDGEANREITSLWQEVQRASENFINIDAIAFGPDAPRDTLERIAKGTHRGKMLAVNSLRELSDALAGTAQFNPARSGNYKPQTTIYCIDASISMRMPMAGEAGCTRIDVVQECLFRDLVVKQKAFA